MGCAKVEAARSVEQEAVAAAASLRQELANEHKICEQFRTLLTSLKVAFEEEKQRRLEVEHLSGITSSKPTPKERGTGPPPPEFGYKCSNIRSSLVGFSSAQSNDTIPLKQSDLLQKENEKLKQLLKAKDAPVDERLRERMKTMHVLSLEEHQDQIAAHEKAYNDLVEVKKEDARQFQVKHEATLAKLEEERAACVALKMEKVSKLDLHEPNL